MSGTPGDSTIKLGIPKGSLQDQTIELFKKAGWKITVSSRSYFPSIDDPRISCLLIRAQEMARYVEKGVLDAGLTSLDWVLENNADVQIVSEPAYSNAGYQKARWVLAVPEESDMEGIEDCRAKTIPYLQAIFVH